MSHGKILEAYQHSHSYLIYNNMSVAINITSYVYCIVSYR